MNRTARLVLLLAAATVASACRGYYPRWHYQPNAEVHEVHVPVATGVPARDAEVTARIVGILRPEARGAARKLHTRFQFENTGAEPLSVPLADIRVQPSGGPLLPPSGAPAPLELGPGEQRTAELYFELPEPAEVPNTALLELELRWPLVWNGTAHESSATFRRGRRRVEPVYFRAGFGPAYGPWGFYDPWFRGGYGYGGFWNRCY